jgi:hypothetical protein
VTISLATDRAAADARFKARLVSLAPAGGQPATLDGRMVSLTLRRVDGEWLVTSARIARSDDAVVQ